MNNNVTILGGGSAGWLTGLFLKKTWPSLKITVIEDPTQPPIIAGESGAASLNHLMEYLEVPFDEWILATNAMPKLGGKFNDWDIIGKDFVHGLIPDWYQNNWKSIYPEYGKGNTFLQCALAENIPFENIFYNAALQRIGKLPITPKENGFNIITMPMWHFDSRASANFFKQLGISRGINLVEGKYTHCTKNIDGSIDTIFLKDQRIKSKWYFDCTGFARLLLVKEMQEKLIDYTHLFPARSVLAWWDDVPKDINYTDITALDYGWMWNINLAHRSGNGYIYDPDLISSDHAKAEVEKKLNRKIDVVANLSFTPSTVKNAWKKNVVAVGISNGFLEPLESNGLAAVAIQLEKLSEYWSPESTNNESDQNAFNKDFYNATLDIRDFLSLHYRGHRDDTIFWKSHRYDQFRISTELQTKLDMWAEGFLGIDNTEGYGIENYAIVAQGLNLINIENLRKRILSKDINIVNNFYKNYQMLEKEIDSIKKICYTVKDWKRIVYGKN